MEPNPLKEFTSIREVRVQDILNILDAWEHGVLDHEAVFGFAEELQHLAEAAPSYPKDDRRSILFGVIDALDLMYINPTIPADIPALRTFLTMGQTSPAAAWQYLEDYWERIDRDVRLRETLKQRFGRDIE